MMLHPYCEMLHLHLQQLNLQSRMYFRCFIAKLIMFCYYSVVTSTVLTLSFDSTFAYFVN
jgi:hypothetical protein